KGLVNDQMYIPVGEIGYEKYFKLSEVLQTLTKFCFPFYVDSLTVSQVGQNFTFVLTDIDSKQRFGFCRLSSGAKSCFCILSYLPWFEVFYKLLNILADYTTKGQESQWNELLETLHKLPIPDPGVSVHLSVRNLTEYFVAVDVNNMLHLYASMLCERRILIVCSKLSTLTACIHGSAAMLYPMFWQHVYIPVLPPHLLDYCCAPMPYLIGIHLSLMEKVRNMALDDVVILNVDTNTLETPFDDLQSLPNDVVFTYHTVHDSDALRSVFSTISSLKNRLKKVSTTTGDGVARAFLKAQAAFFGSYRNALKIEPEEPITFCEEAFVSHYRSGAMRQFLQNATQLQLFKQFIDGRLDLLNSGEGFSDVFEEEINMGEDAGSDKLYHQWLSTVRKGSGAILNTVKTKANPAMKTVYKFDITENGCVPTTEEQLPKTAPSPLVEAKDPKFREDRRPITVHFGQIGFLRFLQSFSGVVQMMVPDLKPGAQRGQRFVETMWQPRPLKGLPGAPSGCFTKSLVKPLRHYAVFLSEDSSDDECQREEGPSSGFTESFFFSAPFEWSLLPSSISLSSACDALLALLDPLSTAWSGSTLPPGPTAPNVATPFTPQFSFPPMGTPTPFPQPSLNPFVPSVPATLPAMPLVSTPAGPFGAPPASLGPAFAPSLLLSSSGFCAPQRSQPNLSALSMPNLFGQMPMGAHSLQALGPPAVAPSRIRTLPLARSSARAAEAKQGLALRPGDTPLLPPRAPQGLEPALQPSAPREARDPFEDLLRKTKQDVSPAPAPGSVEQLRKQWETFE
ncbi:hypothetical protein E2I00_008239, partial [Balaenoptera physalus]